MVIGYVAVIQISCTYSECLRKLASTWNRSKDKYNQYRYKSENTNCVYWPILGTYNNWQIIHCIDSRKQNKSTNTDIVVHIKHNAIRNTDLNIDKDISDNDYEAI